MTVDLSGAKWFKSSRSTATRECVEVAFLDGSMVGIRDSKDPGGPALAFTPGEWDAFTDTLSNGGLDRPFA
ncbi:DUF397 domain-containing protein [Nocardia sp. MDA0666]|uniref:DUF397 domain-containing protein n=1 Tax=Nocardia sp. MDA0666 TaxID=2135448 RepID=UPI000D137FF9|nr:DUF397 domain-containing protein [Nocardia sp. MDA0666]PSR69405.1 DUF397 domain-containing protein [Nocardia sp. MDA0666]